MNAIAQTAFAEQPLSALSDEALERSIQQLSNDDAWGHLDLCLAEKVRRAEARNPYLKLSRLGRGRLELEDKATAQADLAAEFFGKAAGRRLRAQDMSPFWAKGELALAADFEARAKAAEAVGVDCAKQAFAKQLEAAMVDWAIGEASALRKVAS